MRTVGADCGMARKQMSLLESSLREGKEVANFCWGWYEPKMWSTNAQSHEIGGLAGHIGRQRHPWALNARNWLAIRHRVENVVSDAEEAVMCDPVPT